ncbi:NADH-ubiquinone oxidoreductase B12 subunit family-domain-containing protein [Endogone sp. FLAS-F59071]|nr:NADH-ubiquinone oxidoreductase B12 subunit family-domain-containing protein [Endogone sp. FLAS-F59071]|eukprot:RUS19745.1 NADH-ubiquinone oxidoreductase B12 subunit family-domain-containing protein [Endogone sp. FLAS-F59071]
MAGKTLQELQHAPARHDPWAQRDAWRKSSLFSTRTMFRNMFPGLGIATVAFAVYLGYEAITAPGAKKENHH